MRLMWTVWLWLLSGWNFYGDVFLHWNGYILWLGGAVTACALLTTSQWIGEALP